MNRIAPKTPSSNLRGQAKSLTVLRNRDLTNSEEKRPVSKNLNAKSTTHIRANSFNNQVVQGLENKSVSALGKTNQNKFSGQNSAKEIPSTQSIYFKGSAQIRIPRYNNNSTLSKITIQNSKTQQQIQTEQQLHQAIDQRPSPLLKHQKNNPILDVRLPKLGPVKARHDVEGTDTVTNNQQSQFQTNNTTNNNEDTNLRKSTGIARSSEKRLTVTSNNQSLTLSKVMTQKTEQSLIFQQKSRDTTPLPQSRQSESPGLKSSALQTPILNIDIVGAKTQAGKNPDKTTKTNQDSYFAFETFAQSKNKSLFSVCDGHGVEGHKASQFVREMLPKLIHQQIQKCQTAQQYKDVLTNAFKQTNKMLVDDSEVDCTFSGSTCVLSLSVGKTIYVANIGDSRIIVGSMNGNSIQGISISNDHKPDLPVEKKRIEQFGGRVQPYLDFDGSPIGPARVWMKEADIPGLAMSRSFGDRVAAQCGVISEPEITTYEITDNDKFLVLASDGVWEFLSSQQVAEMVYPFYKNNQIDQACTKLVKDSTTLWKQNDEVIDDITCIVIFLKK